MPRVERCENEHLFPLWPTACVTDLGCRMGGHDGGFWWAELPERSALEARRRPLHALRLQPEGERTRPQRPSPERHPTPQVLCRHLELDPPCQQSQHKTDGKMNKDMFSGVLCYIKYMHVNKLWALSFQSGCFYSTETPQFDLWTCPECTEESSAAHRATNTWENKRDTASPVQTPPHRNQIRLFIQKPANYNPSICLEINFKPNRKSS